ncbi:YlmH family RNA-binding protein [Streptococcus dentapri]|uniref:RNA-binding protein n=1 Tax=Streptococcus dentapri TaxID=573564 RepID=A0ABV8CYP9_9STRE
MVVERDIYQHFLKEERTFIDKMTDLAKRVQDTYTFQVTDFLDPRQVMITGSVCGQMGIRYYVSSDYIPTEYAKIILAPDYYELEQQDFDLSLLEISYNSKFNQLTHAQIMGSFINKLGIQRTVFGDIILADNRAQIIVNTSMITYFSTVEKIGKTSVKLREVDFSQLLKHDKKTKEIDVLVSSLRLDKLIASVFKLSRSISSKLVEQEKVKLNYVTMTRPSELLELGDLVSVRGYGRFELYRDDGLSKNKKHKLTIKKYVNK